MKEKPKKVNKKLKHAAVPKNPTDFTKRHNLDHLESITSCHHGKPANPLHIQVPWQHITVK